MNSIKASAVLIALLFVSSFCAHAQTVGNSSNSNSSVRGTEKFDYIFQEALRQKEAGHLDIAFDLFDYCHRLNPESSATLSELASFYSTLYQDSIAIQYLERACKLQPNNYWYKNHLVMLYFRNRRNADALVAVEDMAARFPEKTDVLMMLLDLYENKQDFPNMIKTLNKIEVKEGKSEQLSMEKFKIYLRMNDEQNAFAEMESLAKEYPNDLRYQVVLGDLYRDAGKEKEALKMYKSIEAKDPQNITLLLSLSNYYQTEGPDSLYQRYITQLVTHPNLDTSARARLLRSLVYDNLSTENADSTVLFDFFDKALALPQENTEVLELKVRYMVTKQMPKEDIKPLLLEMLEIDPESDVARQQLLQYAIDDNDDEEIIKVCRPAVEYKSSDPLYYYYLGVSYMRGDRRQEALSALRQCVDRVGNEEGDNHTLLLVNSHSLMAEIYHQLGQDEKAFVAYDSVLIYKPNDILALNNYAYYLSLHKRDLQRAEQMSKKTIEMEPDNATYLDTYAWILFMLKRYDEAKQWMDRVQELTPPEELAEDSDVLYHIQQINKKSKKR